jgi:phosphohistidine swiveling domain-containing protein
MARYWNDTNSGSRGEVLAEGRAIGQRIGSGKVRIVPDIEHLARVEGGDVLVTDMTDPDWEPVMKRASAIVTNRGGRTCHAAIIAREMGVPAWSAVATPRAAWPTAPRSPYPAPKATTATSTRASWIGNSTGGAR